MTTETTESLRPLRLWIPMILVLLMVFARFSSGMITHANKNVAAKSDPMMSNVRGAVIWLVAETAVCETSTRAGASVVAGVEATGGADCSAAGLDSATAGCSAGDAKAATEATGEASAAAGVVSTTGDKVGAATDGTSSGVAGVPAADGPPRFNPSAGD